MLTHSIVEWFWLCWCWLRFDLYGLKWAEGKKSILLWPIQKKWMKHCEIRGWKNGINATCLVSRRSKVGGTQANLLKFSSWWKITAIIGFSGDDGGNTSLHKMSIHSSTPSCKGVNRESDIVDIMYGVESLWTGTATAFISTVHSWRRSSSLNLIVRKKLKII